MLLVDTGAGSQLHLPCTAARTRSSSGPASPPAGKTQHWWDPGHQTGGQEWNIQLSIHPPSSPAQDSMDAIPSSSAASPLWIFILKRAANPNIWTLGYGCTNLNIFGEADILKSLM